MSENADAETIPPNGTYDVYLAYAEADESIAKTLKKELHRLRPGLSIWCEKEEIGVGDAFNQTSDEAISGCGVVLAIWTPESARTGAFNLEVRRALTLRKPFMNLLAGVSADSLTPPLSKYSALPVEEIASLAGRSDGWLPPLKPGQDKVDEALKPVLTKIDEFLRMVGEPASDISDGLIAGLIDATGEPHSASFEAMLKSIAPGDPATAIEVLLLSGYKEAEINTLISPQRVKIADPAGERPEWGAWYVRPHVRKAASMHKDNGALYAAGGFLAAALGAAALWFIGSTMTAGRTEFTSAGTSPVTTDTGESNLQPASTGNSGTAPAAETTTPEPAEALPPCTVNEDGSITGADSRLRADIAPPPSAPPSGDGVESSALPASSETLITCELGEDGTITDVPCQLNTAFALPDPVEVEVPASTPPTKLCITNGDGSITDVPCMVASAVDAPEPERIEIPGETVVEVEELPECDTSRPGARLEAGCKLGEAVSLRLAVCNEDYSNTPCTLATAPTRLTSGTAPEPVATTASAAPPAGETPIDMPDTLEACNGEKSAPCRLTVKTSGHLSLSGIAQTYYGDRNAWCMIYRANQETFGQRNQTRVAGDPNCIFQSDVFDLPSPTEDGTYSTEGCPAARTHNRCFSPIEE